jgi:hypothetical protein
MVSSGIMTTPPPNPVNEPNKPAKYDPTSIISVSTVTDIRGIEI